MEVNTDIIEMCQKAVSFAMTKNPEIMDPMVSIQGGNRFLVEGYLKKGKGKTATFHKTEVKVWISPEGTCLSINN